MRVAGVCYEATAATQCLISIARAGGGPRCHRIRVHLPAEWPDQAAREENFALQSQHTDVQAGSFALYMPSVPSRCPGTCQAADIA